MGTEWIVPTDQGKVRVTLDTVPTDLGERNRLITDALQAGRFTPVAPSMGDVGIKALQGAATTLAPLVVPGVTIGMGAARGAAMGASMGPIGAATGAVAGGILGGVTGFAGNNLADVAIRQYQGQPQKPFGQQVSEVVGGGVRAGAEGAMFNALAPITGAFIASRAGQQLAQETTARAARGFGIELTAAEQTGTPFLRGTEAVAGRSFGGAGSFRDIGDRQTSQAIRAGTEIGEGLTGPALDQVARSNRFAAALKGRIAEFKQQANEKFSTYLRAAGPTSPMDVAPMVAEALRLEAELPKLKSLQNSRLKSLITDIKHLGKDRPPTVEASPILDPTGRAMETVVEAGGPQITTLAEIRKIRSALGDIAYPDRLGGVAVVDAPVAQARQLYGRLTQMLEADADARGLRPLLDDANQFYKTFVGGVDGNRMYTALLDNEKQLGSFSRQLFNVKDTSMLLDAKNIISPEGWKMIQQQYWDDVFTANVKQAPTEAVPMFLGKQFADRVQKDKSVLRILFSPDEVKTIESLADVVRVASPTMSVTRNRDFTGGMIGIFIQGGGAGGALHSMGSEGVGVGNLATLMATTAVPYLFGKAVTNPTTAKIIAAAAKAGRLDATTGEVVVKYLGRAGAIKLNEPERAIDIGSQ